MSWNASFTGHTDKPDDEAEVIEALRVAAHACQASNAVFVGDSGSVNLLAQEPAEIPDDADTSADTDEKVATPETPGP